MTDKNIARLIKGLEVLASVRLTLVCLAMAMALVVLGTLAQVEMGTFAAQEYFNSWWLYNQMGDLKVPTFPGGLTVGLFWMVNLLAAFAVRFNYQKKDIGLLTSHFGVILLLLGQFLTQMLANETNMPLRIGQSRNYTEAFRDTELVLIKDVGPDLEEVTSIPAARLAQHGNIPLPKLPYYLVVHRFIKNAQLAMGGTQTPSMATQGVGTRVSVQEIPPVSSDEEANSPAAFVEIREGTPGAPAAGQSLGIYLVSPQLGAPQNFVSGGENYRLAIRQRRFYLPFTLTLKEFHHDRYPGTDIPKNFSSLVHLSDPGNKEERDALIYMNHPLRYGGQTFYQASFGEGDRLSVFQVVNNPAAWAPYISCALVVIGLGIQFLSHLLVFVRKRT